MTAPAPTPTSARPTPQPACRALPGGYPTLHRLRRHGALRAMVGPDLPGLSWCGPDGRWRGLDAEIARAVAAAVLGDPDAVDWLPTEPPDRLPLLVSGEADLTICHLTWTMGREAEYPVLFAGVTCYDGEGFLVRADSGIEDPAQLAGRPVAVLAGTTSAANLADWYGGRGLTVRPVPYSASRLALASYLAGDCDAYVLDRTVLAGQRAGLPEPGAHRLLDTVISREPMALAVRDTDIAWFRLCRWVLQLLVAAEHQTDRAGPDRRQEALAAAARAAGRHGPAVGLDDGWAARVLAAVGSYGEVYERSLGRSSGLGVPRGPNELWTRGGLHYAVPLY